MTFVPVDVYNQDSEYLHVNPTIIFSVRIEDTIGIEASSFPHTVVVTLINLEEVDYTFRTKEEAKAFVRAVGDLK